MNRYLLVLRLGVAAFLISALGDRGPAFYSLLRVVTAFAAVEAMWLAFLQQKRPWILAFGFVTLVWNPVWPLRMAVQAWQLLDLAAAVLFVLSVPLLHADSLLPKVRWRPSRRFAFGSALTAATIAGLVYAAATYRRASAKPTVQTASTTQVDQEALAALDRAAASPPIYLDDNGNPIPTETNPKPLDERYEALVRFTGGRIVRSDYYQLGSVRRILLELRLQKAAKAGDPVAQQALRDIDGWGQE